MLKEFDLFLDLMMYQRFDFDFTQISVNIQSYYSANQTPKSHESYHVPNTVLDSTGMQK